MKRITTLFVLLSLLTGGCGGGGVRSISGLLTLDGAPLDRASITLIPENKSAQGAVSQTDAEGKFELLPPGAASLPAGNYRVIVFKPALGKPGEPPPAPGSSAVPAIYQNPDTTPVKISLPLSDKLVVELKTGA